MSSQKSQRKRGRKQKPFIAADGTPIAGLRRRKNDGRWVVLATGKMFAEADEATAIRRFREMTGDGDTAHWSDEHWKQAEERRQLPMTRRQIWKWVADMIRKRPQWVAEQTGIEQLGYLQDLKPPATDVR